MNSEKLSNISVIIDIVLKGIVGLVVTLGGFFIKEIHNDIQVLKKADSEKATEIAVTKFSVGTLKEDVQEIKRTVNETLRIIKR